MDGRGRKDSRKLIMHKIQIQMPESAGMKGLRNIELPNIPRVGEYIKDANNRYYRIVAIAYQPFNKGNVEVILDDTEFNSIP